MTNHFHLLVRTEAVTIGDVIGPPMARVAQRWNWEHERKGPIFDDRFKSISVTDESYFLNAARYIEYNPVKAGIVQNPEDYPWSSARAYLAGIEDNLTTTERLLSYLPKNDGVSPYRAWLSAPLPALWPHADQPEWEGEAEPSVEAPNETLQALARWAAAEYGVSLEQLLSRSKAGRLSVARRELILKASEVGHSGVDIARFVGRTKGFVSQVLAACRAEELYRN